MLFHRNLLIIRSNPCSFLLSSAGATENLQTCSRTIHCRGYESNKVNLFDRLKLGKTYLKMAKVIAHMAKYTTRRFPRASRESLFIHSSPYMSLHITRSIGTTRCLNSERLYTEKHEWITVDGKIGIIGISNHAQEALGDIVYAQLPDVGSTIQKEAECGALESVKAASELYSPVSGKITDKNEEVEKTPSLINTSCYEKGWLFKLEINKPDELKNLMNEEAYNLYLKSADPL